MVVFSLNLLIINVVVCYFSHACMLGALSIYAIVITSMCVAQCIPAALVGADAISSII